MKKIFFTIMIVAACNIASAANLIEVYQQAVQSDPTFQQAISQRLSDRQAVPISRAGLLPSLIVQGGPQGSLFTSQTQLHGNATQPGHSSIRGYDVALNLSQTVFDFAKFSNLAGAKSAARAADATFNAAAQDLMIRSSKAYFQVLLDEDNLLYIDSTKRAFQKQLDQVTQQYKVGLKTITDVYTAQASYDGAIASYIQAENTLRDDRENLRAIAGVYYPSLAKLSERFPLVTPHPANIEQWVRTAEQQNWQVKAAERNMDTARQNIKQQFAGHLPVLNLQGQYNLGVTRTEANDSAIQGGFNPNGSTREVDRSVSLNLSLPIFQGGLVVAQTDKAQYDYQVAGQRLEFQTRNVINATRQSYLGVISGISKVRADKQSIKSNESSLDGMEAAYRVGTETLVDVLNQQQKVFQAQQQYSTDRYAYVNNLLALKQAAGTLCVEDLRAINAWLGEHRYAAVTRYKHTARHAKKSAKTAEVKKPVLVELPRPDEPTSIVEKKVVAKKEPDVQSEPVKSNERIIATKKTETKKPMLAINETKKPLSPFVASPDKKQLSDLAPPF